MDPALCTGDGQTYERAAITRWLETYNTSPVTSQPLQTRDLIPNHALHIEAAQSRR